MGQLSYGDKIFKLLQKLGRNLHYPDIHSFKANTKDGVVFAEAREGEVYIRHIPNNAETASEYTDWAGTYIAAANRLEMLGLDLNSVEI